MSARISENEKCHRKYGGSKPQHYFLTVRLERKVAVAALLWWTIFEINSGWN